MKLRWDILKHYTLELGIYLCSFLFVYAAVSKLLDFETFETQLGQSPLLSAYAKPVAIGVPLLELLISLLLVFKRSRRIALYGFFAMMVMFTTYIVIILNFTDFVPCSCGGVLETLGWTEHLIFNGVFVLLSGYLLWSFLEKGRKKFWVLGVLTVFSVSVVTAIFLSSEKQIKRNNAFQRLYIPHALEKIGEYKLESNAFYIAGVDSSTIYLGNYNAPLYLKTLSVDLNQVRDFKIEIDNYKLPYKRVRIEVRPPHFFVGDGTVPILFKGANKDWKARLFSQDDAFFYQFVLLDSMTLVVLTTSTQTNANTLGILHKEQNIVRLKLHPQVLKNQMDGTFDTNGQLLWNEQTQEVIYVYYYRNQFEVADKDLNFLFTGKTIDTISRAVLDIAHYTAQNESKLGNSILVNRFANSYGQHLYINSDRLGKYENDEILKSASIIDQYHIKDNAYLHSFYFYHQYGEKLREFKVVGDFIIGVVNDTLWVYRIKTEIRQ